MDNVHILASALERESVIVRQVVDCVEQKKQWEDRFAEAKRCQGVAKEVYEAASQARTAIVHRVFTESLNEVWKSVCTRLAPDESFIPRFGIPSATKKTFDIKLETIHRDGETSGPPQMMLSAGNLNTAALSLSSRSTSRSSLSSRVLCLTTRCKRWTRCMSRSSLPLSVSCRNRTIDRSSSQCTSESCLTTLRSS